MRHTLMIFAILVLVMASGTYRGRYRNIKYERHIQIPAFVAGNPAASPSPATVGTAGGLQFSNAVDNTTYLQWELPSDWDGLDIYFEVDFLPDQASMLEAGGTDTVQWNIAYRSIAEGELITLGSAKSVDFDYSTAVQGDLAQYTTYHARLTLPAIDADQPLTAEDHLYITVSRDVSDDNFASTVFVTAFEIIYTSVDFPAD